MALVPARVCPGIPTLTPRLETGEPQAHQLIGRKTIHSILLKPPDIVRSHSVDAQRDEVVGAQVAISERCKLLQKIRELMSRLDRVTEFEDYVEALRVEYKRKRNFIKLLDTIESL